MVKIDPRRKNKTMIISEDRKAWLSEKIKWNYSIFGTLPLDALVCAATLQINDKINEIEVCKEWQYKLVNKNGNIYIVDSNNAIYNNFNKDPYGEINIYSTYTYKNTSINETATISLNKDHSINIKGKTEYSVIENMKNEINTISNETNIKNIDKFNIIFIFPLVKCAPLVRIYSDNYIADSAEEYIERLKKFDDENCFFNSLSLKSEYRKTIVNYENPVTGYPMSYSGKIDDILKVWGDENFYYGNNGERILETKEGIKAIITDNKKEISYNGIIFCDDVYKENKKSFLHVSKNKYLEEVDKILKDIEYPFIKSCKDFILKVKSKGSTFVDTDDSANYTKISYLLGENNYDLNNGLIIEIFDNKLLKCSFISNCTMPNKNDIIKVKYYYTYIIDLAKNNTIILFKSENSMNKNNKPSEISSKISRLGGVFVYEKYINDTGEAILKSDSIDGSFIIHLASMDSNIITKIEKFESPIYSLNDNEIYIRDEYSVPKKYIISDEARNNTI